MALFAAYVLILAVPAALLTGFVAVIVRTERVGLRRRQATIAAVGLAAPAAMLGWGCWHLVRAGDAPTDMIPPGPGLMMAALPAAALCLLTSWLILRRR